ncbi:MAG: CDP-alcohol phosphatidyltransferase family protein [Bacteroidota bacterium]
MPEPLRWQWWGTVAAASCVLAVSGLLLGTRLTLPMGPWSLGAGLAVGYILVYTRFLLRENRRADGTRPLPTLGIATSITLGRALCFAVLFGFLFIPPPPEWLRWTIALVFLVASLSDLLDGYLARLTDHVTELGARLDVEADALGMLVASALTVHFGILPWPFLGVGLLYYGYRLMLYAREQRGLVNHDLPESGYRRVAGGFGVGFFVVVLFPLFDPPAATWAGVLFIGPVLLSFLRDGLITTGMIQPSAPRYIAIRAVAKRILLGYVPVAARLVLAVSSAILVSVLCEPWLTATGSTVGWSLWGVGTMLLVTLVTVGWMGRLLAHVLLLFVCYALLTFGSDALTMTVLLSTILVMVAGTGRISLWQPEEAILTRTSTDASADSLA